jgi:hypothetical protein
MKSRCGASWAKCVLIALFIAGTSCPVYGDTMVATYSTATSQTPNTTALCAGTTGCWVGMQTFDSWNTGNAPTSTWAFPTLVSSGTVSGSTISGTITGTFSGNGPVITTANEYGGAGGTGNFADVSDGKSYTLTLGVTGNVPGVNYFGLWFSALDNGNDLKFYDGSTLVLDFTPALYQQLVGACPNAFCGNPNPNMTTKGVPDDSTEQFAFLNFFDETGYITSIKFTETTSAGFESDNFTTAYQDPSNPNGTVITNAPEPGSFVLLLSGLLVLAGLIRYPALKAQR